MLAPVVCRRRSRCLATFAMLAVYAMAVATGGGCASTPRLLGDSARHPVDRKFVEFPSGYQLELIADRLTAPSAISFAPDGTMFVAETGVDGNDVRIYGWHPDGTFFNVFPQRKPGLVGFLKATFAPGFRMYGPVGGMAYSANKLYVSHRDEHDLGVITVIEMDGSHGTVVADLPAQGDNAVTDITVSPAGRLFFGVGSATNAGVVGLDNFAVGWVQQHPRAADQTWDWSQPYLKLLGYRFNTPNPNAGLFSGPDVAVTAPFQPFGVSDQTRVAASSVGKPNAAIYSVSPMGGDWKVEAIGIRLPRGLAFNEFGQLYATDDGMELRGTRPVQDDPDALLKVISGTWYGWPDYTTDLQPVSDARFQPPQAMVVQSGYPDVSPLIDHATSGLLPPSAYRDTLVRAAFPSLSGAAKFDFVPESSAFKEFHGNAIVALSGDRAPFATSGVKLDTIAGYKVVRVDVDTRVQRDFIHNTKGIPASRSGDDDALERPVDIKFGPDGAMYLLDFGEMRMSDGHPRINRGTGKLYKLTPIMTDNSQH